VTAPRLDRASRAQRLTRRPSRATLQPGRAADRLPRAQPRRPRRLEPQRVRQGASRSPSPSDRRPRPQAAPRTDRATCAPRSSAPRCRARNGCRFSFSLLTNSLITSAINGRLKTPPFLPLAPRLVLAYKATAEASLSFPPSRHSSSRILCLVCVLCAAVGRCSVSTDASASPTTAPHHRRTPSPELAVDQTVHHRRRRSPWRLAGVRTHCLRPPAGVSFTDEHSPSSTFIPAHERKTKVEDIYFLNHVLNLFIDLVNYCCNLAIRVYDLEISIYTCNRNQTRDDILNMRMIL
jgi:hypothetical protein